MNIQDYYAHDTGEFGTPEPEFHPKGCLCRVCRLETLLAAEERRQSGRHDNSPLVAPALHHSRQLRTVLEGMRLSASEHTGREYTASGAAAVADTEQHESDPNRLKEFLPNPQRGRR